MKLQGVYYSMIEKLEEIEALIIKEIGYSSRTTKQLIDLIDAVYKNRSESWNDWRNFSEIAMSEQINRDKKPSFWKEKIKVHAISDRSKDA